MDAGATEAQAPARTPVLPRGSAEPPRELPPLESLCLHEGSTPASRRLSPLQTPEPRARRPSWATPASPTPAPQPTCDVHAPGTVLLTPDAAWRVPFLVPHQPDTAEAQLVRHLGLRPRYMWRAAVGCRHARAEGVRTLYGDVWVPWRGGSVGAPACLHCRAAGRECLWVVRAKDDVRGVRAVQLSVLAERGLGAAVAFRESDTEFATTLALLADALHVGHGREWTHAWEFALPALLSIAERMGIEGQPRTPVCPLSDHRSYILAEDGEARVPLPAALEHMVRPHAYDPLLVKDLLRRLPTLPGCVVEGNPAGDSMVVLDDRDVPVHAGLLRAGAEWGAWSFDQEGLLTLFLRETERHRQWQPIELEKIFLGTTTDYSSSEETSFTLWPRERRLDLPVRKVVKELIPVGADDMAAAALHAVECSVTRVEPSWRMEQIRERHRDILARDASIGDALHDLFRRSRHAADMAVRLAANSDSIVQIS